MSPREEGRQDGGKRGEGPGNETPAAARPSFTRPTLSGGPSSAFGLAYLFVSRRRIPRCLRLRRLSQPATATATPVATTNGAFARRAVAVNRAEAVVEGKDQPRQLRDRIGRSWPPSAVEQRTARRRRLQTQPWYRRRRPGDHRLTVGSGSRHRVRSRLWLRRVRAGGAAMGAMQNRHDIPFG